MSFAKVITKIYDNELLPISASTNLLPQAIDLTNFDTKDVISIFIKIDISNVSPGNNREVSFRYFEAMEDVAPVTQYRDTADQSLVIVLPNLLGTFRYDINNIPSYGRYIRTFLDTDNFAVSSEVRITAELVRQAF